MSILSSDNELEKTQISNKWSFLSSLRKKKKCFINETRVGLLDETIVYKPQRNSIISNNASNIHKEILSYYVFDQYSTCLSYSIFSKFLTKNADEELVKDNLNKTIFKISKWFTHSLDSNGKIFKFNKIKLGNIKLYVISKNNIVLITIFNLKTNSSYCKLISLHIYMTFINYVKDNLEYIDYLYDQNDNIPKTFTTLLDFKDKINKNIMKNYFPFVLYDNFYVKYLAPHFSDMFTYLVKKDEIILPGIHFKNIYVINLNCSFEDEKCESTSNYEILFDLRDSQTDKKYKKIYKSYRLLHEIVFQAKKIMYFYCKENGTKFIDKDLMYKFIKLELTSTYPRITFIIKFLPIMKGICIVHMYTQKKLSRPNGDQGDSTRQNTQINEMKGGLHNCLYEKRKEFDILYAQELRNDKNIEFKYSEPQKMIDLGCFMKEFFICRKNCDLFNDENYKLSYFNQEINKIIDESVKYSKDLETAIQDAKDALTKLNEDKTKMNISHDNKSLLSETNNEESELLSKSESTSRSKLSSSSQFKSLIKLNKFYILSLIFSPIPSVYFKDSSKKNDDSKTHSFSQSNLCKSFSSSQQFEKDYTLSLSKIEKPDPIIYQNNTHGNVDESVTINQSKSLSIIKPRPPSVLNTNKVGYNLEKLLDESSSVEKNEEMKGTTLLTKTSTEQIMQDYCWEKRVIKKDLMNQQLIIMDDNIQCNDDYEDCLSGHKFVEYEVKPKKTTFVNNKKKYKNKK